jgi:hypothetical protein
MDLDDLVANDNADTADVHLAQFAFIPSMGWICDLDIDDRSGTSNVVSEVSPNVPKPSFHENSS